MIFPMLGPFDEHALRYFQAPQPRDPPIPVFTNILRAKWCCPQRKCTPLKRWQSLAWGTRRLRPRWACHSQRRSGGCRGRPRRARWCRTTLGDHVVLRLVCVLFSLHLSSHTPRVAANRVVAQIKKKGPFRVLHVSKLGPETFLRPIATGKLGQKGAHSEFWRGAKPQSYRATLYSIISQGPCNHRFPLDQLANEASSLTFHRG